MRVVHSSLPVRTLLMGALASLALFGCQQPPAAAPGEGEASGAEQAGEGAPGADDPVAAVKPDDPKPPNTEGSAAPGEIPVRVTIEASFTGLPAGARVVAASPMDGLGQKVTKSEHKGVKGAVVSTEQGDNLFFVSDAIVEGATTATYRGEYEVILRGVSSPDPNSAATLDYEDGAPKVGALTKDPALVAAAGALSVDSDKPVPALLALFAQTVAMDRSGTEGGAGAAWAAKKGTPVALANAFVGLSRLKGIPARVVQGVRAEALFTSTPTPHIWSHIAIPAVGWTVWDPALRATDSAADDFTFMGKSPADRLALVLGSTATLPADGEQPEIVLSGALATPRAILNGAEVGAVTFKVTFAKMAAPAPK